ncbi:MAG: FRG domain-containing protein [Clostridia bacterium]|nr:FRG domain-containing protein [Clostridia bacterium]
MKERSYNDITIHSWEELIEKVYENSYRSDINRYRTSFVFRGISDKGYELKTSLERNCKDNCGLENSILRNFIKYARLGAESEKNIWKVLAIAQHHGLPTRLLDWTYSPFVAMHFATFDTDSFDKDGVIWCINIERMHEVIPGKLRTILKRENAYAFTTEMLSEKCSNLGDFDTLSDNPFLLFFEPPSLDDRIINQFGLHSVVSNPTIIHDEILVNYPDYYKRLIIPKEIKLEIRDKLDQANINERVLFPGLDGLCTWLARHYRPLS